MAEFIDCTSLNISFNVMGIATVSYTVVHDKPGFVTYNKVDAGGQSFTGYVVNASVDQILNTSDWFETHVTLIATTN